MFRADIRLYKGRRPSLEQLQYIDEKIKKLVTANYVRDFKLKEGQPELVKLIDDTMKSEAYAKGKRVILNDAINGVNSQVQEPAMAKKEEEAKKRAEEEKKRQQEQDEEDEGEEEEEEMEEEEEEELET